ncbi:hypothetical protein [Planctopirus limnophila]|uniref:hypothetical protein n=1 Tax=Planctopirus limnophila TaxID=120 RepID=UPI0003107FDB|nr:hypothetical protein [Planctopirus limnophila]
MFPLLTKLLVIQKAILMFLLFIASISYGQSNEERDNDQYDSDRYRACFNWPTIHRAHPQPTADPEGYKQ